MTVAAMGRALAFGAEVASGVSKTELARRHSLNANVITRDLRLLRLPADLQARVLAGEIRGATTGPLMKLLDLPAAEQTIAFEALCLANVGNKPRAAHARLQPKGPPPSGSALSSISIRSDSSNSAVSRPRRSPRSVRSPPRSTRTWRSLTA